MAEYTLELPKGFTPTEDPFCEHCGHLENYSIEFQEDDGCTWCLSCAQSIVEITDHEMTLIQYAEHIARIGYLEEELEVLKHTFEIIEPAAINIISKKIENDSK